MQKFFFFFLCLLSLFVTRVQAENFTWVPVEQEPSFSVDVPSNWLRDYQHETNLSRVYFFLEQNSLELRSLREESPLDLTKKISLLAAEMSIRYDYLRLQTEGKAPFRDDVYRVVWLAEKERQKFMVQAFFLQKEKNSLLLLCQSSEAQYEQKKVFFDNAAYSFQIVPYQGQGQNLQTQQSAPQENTANSKPPVNFERVLSLKKFFPFNRGSNKDYTMPADKSLKKNKMTTINPQENKAVTQDQKALKKKAKRKIKKNLNNN